MNLIEVIDLLPMYAHLRQNNKTGIHGQIKRGYDRQVADLAERFKKNFTQFTLASDEVWNAGPR
jgi:hypothetical protein